MTTCTEKYAVLYCTKCGERFLHPIRCNTRTCPKCAKIRAKRYYEVIYEVVKNWQWCVHIVLTYERVQDIGEGVRAVKQAFSKLKRYVGWKRVVNSAIGFIETKPKPDGWHVHIHVLAECRWLEVTKLAEMWKKATKGKGYIVHITRAGYRKGAVNEVVKYVLKVSWMNEEHKREFEEALKNVKLVVRDRFDASLLDNTEMFEHLKCPKCKGDIEWVPGLSRIVSREEVETIILQREALDNVENCC